MYLIASRFPHVCTRNPMRHPIPGNGHFNRVRAVKRTVVNYAINYHLITSIFALQLALPGFSVFPKNRINGGVKDFCKTKERYLKLPTVEPTLLLLEEKTILSTFDTINWIELDSLEISFQNWHKLKNLCNWQTLCDPAHEAITSLTNGGDHSVRNISTRPPLGNLSGYRPI